MQNTAAILPAAMPSRGIINTKIPPFLERKIPVSYINSVK